MPSSSDLLATLQQHLQDVHTDPSRPLDEKLLDECVVFLPPTVKQNPSENHLLVSQISRLSPKLRQDPSALVRLLEKLVQPFSFEDVLAIEPPVDFAGGLAVEALPYNRVMLQLLKKASASTSDLDTLANLQPVVKALVQLWLSTPDVGVADEASSVLLALLESDKEAVDVAVHGISATTSFKGGHGLLWRRIFDDKDIYSVIFASCNSNISRKDRSLAQARLLSVAPRLGALDWSCLTKSHNAEIEKNSGINPPKEGLLDFIAVHMADYKEDVLIHLNLIQFYCDLIKTVKQPSSEKDVSVSLHLLRERGLHQRSLSFWLLPNDPSHDPLDLTFLSGPSAQYMSTYVFEYPNAFLRDQIQPAVLQRLSRALSISAGQWAQGQSPKHDLNVLASLPRVSLLPQMGMGVGRHSTPLLLVPCKNTSADALNTLATIFRGPQSSLKASSAASSELSVQPPSYLVEDDAEAAAARAIFYVYHAYHDSLFSDLIDHANIVAIPDKALAAFNVISSIAEANWPPLPRENRFSESSPPIDLSCLPSEAKLISLLPSVSQAPRQLAASGIEALLQSPIRERVFPFLLKPAQTFTHLVGGRGDPESNAYKVATGKWDCLILVQKRLAELEGMGEGNEQTRSLLAAIADRVQEGVWGSQSQAGGYVASLEL
ncbi:MAG: hypothetical protein Q9159_005558 [Coniocarpon cinnabarinum]